VNEVVWHDVECGGYEADLGLWEELADATEGPIMELGCGTGRVTTHLGKGRGRLVIGIDSNADLVAALWERVGEGTADAEVADARDFEIPEEFGLALAPMQLIQLLNDSRERIACLSCVADHLAADGQAAFAIVEEFPPALPEGAVPPLPDVHQVEGWIYSSLPLEAAAVEGSIVVRRLRQTVSPDGELNEELNEVELRMLTAEALEREAAEAGLSPIGRRAIPATDAHVGSTVVVLGKGA
jgi:SAM-dependent methyltransferase